jgi:hypothetical protein
LQPILASSCIPTLLEFLASSRARVAGLAAMRFIDSGADRRLDLRRRRVETDLRGKLHRPIFEQIPTGGVVASPSEGRVLPLPACGEREDAPPRFNHFATAPMDSHGEWVAFHEDGRLVESADHPPARVLDGETRPALDCRCRRLDGSFVWVRLQGEARRDAKGERGTSKRTWSCTIASTMRSPWCRVSPT